MHFQSLPDRCLSAARLPHSPKGEDNATVASDPSAEPGAKLGAWARLALALLPLQPLGDWHECDKPSRPGAATIPAGRRFHLANAKRQEFLFLMNHLSRAWCVALNFATPSRIVLSAAPDSSSSLILRATPPGYALGLPHQSCCSWRIVYRFAWRGQLGWTFRERRWACILTSNTPDANSDAGSPD